MKTLAALIMAAIGITGCGSGSVDDPQNRKLLYDTVDRELFVKELTVRKIPYRLDESGGIWYSPRDEKAVDEIMSMIKSERSKPATNYEDPASMLRFKELLNISGIPFQIVERNGRDWISWSEHDDARVKEIQGHVEREGDERRLRGQAAKAAPKSSR